MTNGTPTQVAHPVRALLRTLVVSLMGLGTALLARWGIDIAGIADGLVDWLTNTLWLVFSGLWQWAITRPGVNEWLIKYVTPLSTGAELEDH